MTPVMSESQVLKKRIEELDIMKGIGIIVIAVYHIVYRSMDGIADKLVRSWGWAFIGVFFLLSGYTCRQTNRVRESYKRRVLGLVLPVIIVEFLLLFFGGLYCIFMHDYSVKSVLYDALVTFLRPEITTRISSQWGEGGILFFNLSPVWFIWSMAWTELFFHPLRLLIVGKGEKVWLLLLTGLIAIQVPMYVFLPPASWGLTVIPTYLIFMLMGAKLREWDAVSRLMKIKPPAALGISILGLAAQFGCFLFDGNESYYVSILGDYGMQARNAGVHDMMSAIDIPVVLLQLLCFLPAIFFIARVLVKIPVVSRGLVWMGQHTLAILLLHCILAVVYSDIFKNYIKPGSYWYLELNDIELTSEIVLKSILCCILALITCIPLILIWEKLKDMLFAAIARGKEAKVAKNN